MEPEKSNKSEAQEVSGIVLRTEGHGASLSKGQKPDVSAQAVRQSQSPSSTFFVHSKHQQTGWWATLIAESNLLTSSNNSSVHLSWKYPVRHTSRNNV